MSTRLLIGDVFERLAEIPDGSVDLIITSPPFLALRSYLPADHPDKALEIGSESGPAAFLDTLLRLSVEWRRVLAPHGSLCVELGDTFAGSGEGKSNGWVGYDKKDGNAFHAYRKTDGTATASPGGGVGWPLDKSLCGIPTLYPWCLAYGRNLLNPEHTVEPWRIRNLLTWLRPNPPVGALGDKFRPAASFITVACTGRQRYFDLDAVREINNPHRMGEKAMKNPAAIAAGTGEKFRMANGRGDGDLHPAGAPPLDWHTDLDGGVGALILATHPYPGSHYATFPPKLPQRLIEAMCPLRVCRVCGKPSERITSEPEYVTNAGKSIGYDLRQDRVAPGIKQFAKGDNSTHRRVETLGWSDCGHAAWRNGLVLDPFGGSGTVGAVASGMGRDSIMIELDPRNAELCRERIGMFLEEPE